MRRVGFLIFNQMLFVLFRVYIVIAVVVVVFVMVVFVVVVICLIKGICCCCYLSYQGSILFLLLL